MAAEPLVAGKGFVVGDRFSFVIDWTSGSRGEYDGPFTDDGTGLGRLSGVTFDLTNPQSQATWFSERFFRKDRPFP